jgi:hypothetical protein
MSIRTLRWTLPPLALIALVGWLASPHIGGSAPDATNAPQGAGMVPAQGPAVPPPSAAGPDRLAAVQKFVDQKNSESSAQREAFVKAGWEIVKDVPPPDMKLVALDPSLLDGREAELRNQITSTSASPKMAQNLGRIAREAKEESTQVAAVEALGRAGDAGQDQLFDLLDKLPDGTLARREIVPEIKPHDLSDARAAKMAELLDSSNLNDVEKKQLAFTLSLVGLRDRSALPDSVLNKLSSDARALLASTTSLAQLQHH